MNEHAKHGEQADLERVSEPRHPHQPAPHHATRYEASDGDGTVHGWAEGETQDRPVLDGSSESSEEERGVENPWRGIEDPSLERHPERVPESQRSHVHHDGEGEPAAE